MLGSALVLFGVGIVGVGVGDGVGSDVGGVGVGVGVVLALLVLVVVLVLSASVLVVVLLVVGVGGVGGGVGDPRYGRTSTLAHKNLSGRSSSSSAEEVPNRCMFRIRVAVSEIIRYSGMPILERPSGLRPW